MKQVSKLIIGLVALSAMTGVADEYGYFSRATMTDTWSPTQIILNEGDRIVFLTCWNKPSSQLLQSTGFAFSATYNDIPALLSTFYLEGTDGYYPESRRSIIGPCTLSLHGVQSVLKVDYKIIRASDNSISPSNVISLPADVNGDMQLVFESSDDLLTWTQEFSFTHNSTNSGGKFFRTRLIQGAGQ